MTPDIIRVALLSIKILILVGVGLYSAFAAVIVRQEQLMAGVLEESFEPILRIFVLLHLAASIGLFVLALILL